MLNLSPLDLLNCAFSAYNVAPCPPYICRHFGFSYYLLYLRVHVFVFSSVYCNFLYILLYILVLYFRVTTCFAQVSCSCIVFLPYSYSLLFDTSSVLYFALTLFLAYRFPFGRGNLTYPSNLLSFFILVWGSRTS